MADVEELLDYEDDHETGLTGAAASNGAAAAAAPSAGGESEKDKKGYVGIHSTGFR